MTFWELLRAILRYWPVVLVGALCTVLVALTVVDDDGVHFTRTEIIFLAPTSPTYPNALRTQSEDVIDMAGVVAKAGHRSGGGAEVRQPRCHPRRARRARRMVAATA